MARRPRSDWGGTPAALGAMLAVAAALRLVGIRYGLPYGSLLDPDEQNVVPRAWTMVHGGGADPHFFDWPTLVTYLVAPFQWWQHAPSYLTGRFVVVALALLGVASAWWLGERSYGRSAGAIAAGVVAVDSTHVAFSHAAVTDVPLTTFVTAALALLVVGRFELAGAAVGLAAAAKYPGAVAVVPLVVVAWRQWRRLALSLGAAAVAFFAASPFVILDAGSAWSDLRRIQGQHRRGWLGFEHDHWSGVAFVDRLWSGLGPVLIVAAAGLAAAVVLRRSRADLVNATFVLAYFATLLPLHSHFPRYVLPLVPPLGALAGRLRAMAPVTLLLLVVPLTWSVRDDVRLTRVDTRIEAARWIDAHLAKGTVVAQESSTAVPPGYRVLPLPLPLRGDGEGAVTLASLRRRASYVVVSGAVADRVLAASDVYPARAAFYRALEGQARRVFDARAGAHASGPWVKVYAL